MDIKHAERKVLPLALLENNDGQIIGVPRNPRYITEDEYAALKKSIEKDDLTGLLQLIVYPHADKYVVLGGNMRLRALRELGYKEVECAIVPSDADDYTLRKIVQLDNSTFGEYDMDILANDWDIDELKEWNVDVPDFDTEEKPKEDLSGRIHNEYKVEITCTCESEQEELFNRMTIEGYECRILTL